MKKFVLGTLAGAVALAVSLPALAQFVSAQSASSSSSVSTRSRPVPSQACVLAMASLDDATAASIDTTTAARKAVILARSAALKAAASIADDTQRQAAVKKTEDDFRAAMQTAMQSQSTALKSSQDALNAACGNASGFGRGPGFGGSMMGDGGWGVMGPPRRGPGPDLTALAAKLGLTLDQLNTELKSGKTIGQIATEHGVTLPVPPKHQKGRDGSRGWMKGLSAGQSSSVE